MDVVTGLSITTCGKEATRVAMDILTKSSHFLVIKKIVRVNQLVHIYISVIVGCLEFMSSFYQIAIGSLRLHFKEPFRRTEVHKSTIYQPQIVSKRGLF